LPIEATLRMCHAVETNAPTLLSKKRKNGRGLRLFMSLRRGPDAGRRSLRPAFEGEPRAARSGQRRINRSLDTFDLPSDLRFFGSSTL
jgi:hypothetical protein